MAKILTAERVSRDISDNYVFQRSQLAYHEAARRISGDVLEIGTGTGYGIEIVAPHASSFLTLDKIEPAGERPPFPHVEMRQAVVPPSRPAIGQFRLRHLLSGDRTHQTRHGTGAGSAPRTASGRQVHPDHPQYPYVADTQPLARQGIQSRPTPQPARQRLCVGGGPRCFRQRTDHGILRKKPPRRSAHHPFRRARPTTPAAPVDAATPLRPAQPPQPPTPTPGQRLPDPFDHHGRLPHRTGSGRLLRPVLYRGKATQINDSGRIDIRRQSGKNHYKQQPESSSILSSFYPIQS